MWFKKAPFLKKINLWLLLIVLLGGLMRFYKLDWDNGYFFNPDEGRNIAYPAANLKFPYKPDQFVYGSLTIYLYRFLAEVVSFLAQSPIWLSAYQINLIGRFISATVSTSLIVLVYYAGKKIFSPKVGLLASLFTAVNVGLIQVAHFSTTESIITLSGFLIAIAIMLIFKDKEYKKGYLLAGVTLGLALAAKVSALIFFPPFVIAHLFSLNKKVFFKKNLFFLMSLFLIITLFLAAFPYSLLDFHSFIGSFKFESGVASGKISVFWTRQFPNTVPYLYHLTKVLPWTLGIPVIFFGLLGFIGIFKNVNFSNKKLILFFTVPFIYFLYNGSLFVKWTRYMVPLAPFFCLLAAKFMNDLYLKSKGIFRYFNIGVIVIAFFWQVLYSLAFFNIYLVPDSRISASKWIYENITSDSNLLLETGDVVALPLPLKDYYLARKYDRLSFDFYSFDDPTSLEHEQYLLRDLSSKLVSADYFIIGSRRVYPNHLRLKNTYPLTARFYDFLFNNRLGFRQVKTISSYPKIFNFEINDDSAEETFQVFDHPVIKIFKKTKQLSKEAYEALLEI